MNFQGCDVSNPVEISIGMHQFTVIDNGTAGNQHIRQGNQMPCPSQLKPHSLRTPPYRVNQFKFVETFKIIFQLRVLLFVLRPSQKLGTNHRIDRHPMIRKQPLDGARL